MITKYEKLLWIAYSAVLVILFLMSSTDLIIKEKKQEVYPVSVIVEDSTDDNYVNFRKGMEQAAVELNVDVSFITLYDAGDREQQAELALREQQEGARALIVAPVDPAAAVEFLEDDRLQVPLVLLHSEAVPVDDRVSASITFDYHGMGRELGMQIQKEQPPKLPVYLFLGSGQGEAERLFEDGLMSVLEPAGRETLRFRREASGGFRKVIESLVYPGVQNAVIVAMDQEGLVETAGVLKDSSVYASYVSGLYGRGTSILALNELDRGIVRGLCITDDFSAGYLSVQTAVRMISNPYESRQEYLVSGYIEREDLHKEEYEKLLYPIG